MVSYVVIQSLNEFLDYAIFFNTILGIYYFIMFLGGGKETDGHREERQDTHQWINKKLSEGDKEKEKKQDIAKEEKAQKLRKRLLSGTKGFIINAEQAAEKIKHDSFDSLTENERLIAQGFMGEVIENLNSAKKALHVEKRKEHGEKRKYVHELYEEVGYIIRDLYKKGLKEHFPERDDPDLKENVKKLKHIAGNIQLSCGHVIWSIDQFIRENKRHLEKKRHHLAKESLKKEAEAESKKSLDNQVKSVSEHDSSHSKKTTPSTIIKRENSR